MTCLLISQTTVWGQEEKTWAQENIEFRGYVKYLNTTQFQNFDVTLNDNLIHNRLQFKVYLNENFTFDIEMRNRVFWGNSLALVTGYADQINDTGNHINLGGYIVEKPGLLIHSMIDRLYLDYHTDKWQVTLGRQRINWGKNLVWNSNDLFNAYSFFDFDYEERPGTEGLRVQYFTSGNSGLELAVNYTKGWQESTYALKYNFNLSDYDIQILAGQYIDDFVIGTGWEGYLKNVGFKGELSYFTPIDNEAGANVFTGSVSFDYYFKNGVSVNIGTLYNSKSQISEEGFLSLLTSTTSLSPKALMPNQWSFFGQTSKAFTPAITGSLAAMYANEINGVFFMPQLGYSIAQNWDFDTVGQLVYAQTDTEYENIGNAVYLRFRYSF